MVQVSGRSYYFKKICFKGKRLTIKWYIYLQSLQIVTVS